MSETEQTTGPSPITKTVIGVVCVCFGLLGVIACALAVPMSLMSGQLADAMSGAMLPSQQAAYAELMAQTQAIMPIGLVLAFANGLVSLALVAGGGALIAAEDTGRSLLKIALPAAIGYEVLAVIGGTFQQWYLLDANIALQAAASSEMDLSGMAYGTMAFGICLLGGWALLQSFFYGASFVMLREPPPD